jgi:aryl-alcohol dehydrogenase-like predicted oxidoreductase
MPRRATAEGTRRYAARFASASAAGHFREPVGCGTPDEAPPFISSLGIGTYLGEADSATDVAYTAAVVAAVESGINLVDSAINYRLQRSERSIGAALRELATRGFEREEIVLCTKGGFLTSDGVMPHDIDAYFEREYLHP